MNLAQVEKKLGTWQEILGLTEWTLRAELVSGPWRKSADLRHDLPNRLAVVLVHESVAPEHLDEVVVHELVHLRLGGLDRMMEDLLVSLYGEDEKDPRRRFAYAQFMDRLETTTQDLTRSFLALSGNRDLLWTPALERAVREAKRTES